MQALRYTADGQVASKGTERTREEWLRQLEWRLMLTAVEERGRELFSRQFP